MRFWHIARWVLLVFWVLAVVMVLVRGPEDTWIRDASGQWVAHGHPAGPPPPAGYRPPVDERVLPLIFLAVIAAWVVAGAFFSGRSPAGRDDLNRSIRYFGALRVIASALAICLVVLLIFELWTDRSGALGKPEVCAILLGAAIVALKALSWYADGTKRLLEAHYDLKRATAMLQDTLDRLARPADSRPREA